MIGDLGEFGLIRRFREILAQTEAERIPTVATPRPPPGFGVLVDSGDDAAGLLLPAGETTLVSADAMVEEIDFRRDRIRPRDLGYKAVTINVSDIAAMGGRAVALLVVMGLPRDTSVEWCEEVVRGAAQAAGETGTRIVGGDLSRTDGPVFISVTAIGSAPREMVLTRGGARPGDQLYVTGYLGDSALGMKLSLDQGAGFGDSPDIDHLLGAHYRPQVDLDLACSVARNVGATAMIDVSDGFLADLGHLLRASGCGATVEVDRLPLSEPYGRCWREHFEDRWDAALDGGEDFCLIVAVPPTRAANMDGLCGVTGRPACRVGHLDDEAGSLRLITGDGEPYLRKGRGFEHF